MIFDDAPISNTEGALLVHSLRVGARVFKKGRCLTAEDIGELRNAGYDAITVIRYEDGDLDEDSAAARIAEAAAGDNTEVSSAFTGRVNLFARDHGLLVYDADALDNVNLVHESATIAALTPYEVVQPKQMVATIKIIPFAIPDSIADGCTSIAAQNGGLIRIAPFKPLRAGLIQTELPNTKPSVLDKTVRVLSDRLEALDGAIAQELRCAHTQTALTTAINDVTKTDCDVILITGASAITDRRDVIPAALETAGGKVDHFGMPVDPGNLLMLGALDGRPVVGLPSCARSPKLNGFDWILQRIAAQIPITPRDIMRMGAGGLLKEISSRPLPRATATNSATDNANITPPSAPKVAAIVLAAGQSRRMGAANKMSAIVDGLPMAAHAVDAVLASKAAPVIVVVGHEPNVVREIMKDRDVTIVENKHYAKGLSTSVICGANALPDDVTAFLVCLGDMPRISPAQIDRLIAAYDPVEQRAICVPTFNGKWGNPILFDRRFIEEIKGLTGDRGARHLLDIYPELTCEVAMTDDAVLIDVDTPEALAKLAV
jgi:molybdenum cofactor cytidylyltransferase